MRKAALSPFISQDNYPSAGWSQKLETGTLFLFHLLILTVPFFFTWVNEELFEFNKLILTYGITALIVGLWSARMVLEKKLLIRRTPFDLALLCFLGSQVISTLLSIHFRTSVFGYYTRFHGGLLSLLTYTALFYAFVSTVQRRHLRPLLLTVLISALGVCLYAIPEHFGASPSCFLISGGENFGVNCWIQKVQERVFGTFGQPNWLAAYVAMLLPLSLIAVAEFNDLRGGLLKAFQKPKVLLAVATTLGLFTTLVFTKSRSGLLGLGAALATLIGLLVINNAVTKSNFNKSKYVITSTIFVLIFTGISLVFGTPFSPSLSELWHRTPASTPLVTVAETPVANRLENGGTDSGEIRKIVWEGAINIWRRYPLFGSGVETFAYSYYQDRPAAHNLVSEWDFLYNKAHNELLNFLATTGLVGLATYAGLLLRFGLWNTKQILSSNHEISEADKVWLAALISGLVALTVSNFFGFSTVMVTVLMFLFFGVATVIAGEEKWLSLPHWSKVSWFSTRWGGRIGLAAIALLTFWNLTTISNWWLADYDYAQGKSLLGAGETSAGLERLQTASRRLPNEALFWDELSITYAQLAVAYQEQGETEAVTQLSQAAELASDQTLALNNRHLNFYKNRARVFIVLAAVDPSYLEKAQATLEAARTLAPTDAKLLYNLALVTAALGKNPEALEILQATVALKPDYEAAHLELGAQLLQTGDLAAAQAAYQYVLENISADNPTALSQVAAIQASLSAQVKK